MPVWSDRLDSSRGDLVRAACLIEALRANGHDVRVVENATAPGVGMMVSSYRTAIEKILPQRLALILRDIGRWSQTRIHSRRVAAVAAEQDADVIVETHVNLASSGALAARISGRPLLLDDCSPSSEEEDLGAGLTGLARHVFRNQVRAAAMIVVPSRAMCDELVAEGVAREKLRVIPNGVDPSAYEGIDRAAARARLGLNDQCVCGFVGSFEPWHQVELLVRAFSAIEKDHDMHLLLIGDGPQLENVLALSRELDVSNRLTAMGAVSPAQVPEWVSCMDIGVLPGTKDYMHPMKLMEYAAAAVPLVAPDLKSVREVLTPGVNGLLFRAGDADALSEALGKLAGDGGLRRELGKRARELVENDDSWGHRAHALVLYLEDIVNRNGTVMHMNTTQ